ALGVTSTPATGRLAIGGMELGETPWITATPINGWTGNIRYKRERNRLIVAVRSLNGAAATSRSFMDVPPGFRPVMTLCEGRDLLHSTSTSSVSTPVMRTYYGGGSIQVGAAENFGTIGTLYGTIESPDIADGWPSSL